ncbi:TPA: RcnB family protein, partial [Klebsiella michiganensis]
MKKILSLAIILSCALTSVSWADGPGGNNHGQQQVWQQDA